MREEQSYILFAGRRDWQICAASVADVRFANVSVSGASAEQIAVSATETLRNQGYLNQGVLLALPSVWCHAASISTADLPRRNRTAMLYRLEEKLPFAAESVVADFIASANGQSALGVCCQLEVVEPIIKALESNGIVVQTIAPADLLAMQELFSTRSSGDRIVMCADCEVGVNIFAFAAGELTGWSRAAEEHDRLELQLLSSEFPSPPPVEFVSAKGESATFDPTAFPTLTAAHGAASRTAAARAARKVLEGRALPWIELRRDALGPADALKRHRRPLHALLTSAVVLLLAASAAMGVRAVQYHRLEASYRQQLENRFRQQFPGWAIPQNLKVVIESEHRKAADATRTLPPESRKTALRTLLDVLGRLPAQEHFTAQALTFDEDWFDMKGEVGSFEQLDAIASAVRQSGMDVPAPEAHRLPSGSWSFVLHGSRPTLSTANGN